MFVTKLKVPSSIIPVNSICRSFSQLSVATQVTTGTTENSTNQKTRHTLNRQKLGPLNIHDALEIAKQHTWAKFDETLEISIVTGLDPRKPNQSVKGVAKLPAGTGKKIRICVLAKDAAEAKAALEAGADVAGSDEVIKLIQDGDVNFNTIIATPEMMPMVGKIGRILGPRGLMPNPKMGTVTKDIVKAVKTSKAGTAPFKTEKKGVIQAGLGKLSFSKDALLDNVRSFMLAVMDAKPEGFKGKYLKTVYIASTMGPGVELELSSVDPANPKFMLNLNTVAK